MKKHKALKFIKSLTQGLMSIFLDVKHLILTSVIFIIGISCSKNNECSVEGLILIKSEDNKTMILKKSDFKITKNKKCIEVKILNNRKLDSIENLVNCIISFSEKGCVAKGINIMSSIKPDNCNYFFSEDGNQHVIIRKKIITLLSIDI